MSEPRPEITETRPVDIEFVDGTKVMLNLPTLDAVQAWHDYVWEIMVELNPEEADNIKRARDEHVRNL